MTLFIDINDLRINYIDEGEDNGRGIILLLHGWGSNITLFKNIVDMLSPHMRVVAPDMAGFGESDEPKKPWCVDDYVDFIGTFCKKLGIVPTVVLVTVQVPTTLADESPSSESAALSSALFALSSAVCVAELSFLLDESPSLPQPTRPTVPTIQIASNKANFLIFFIVDYLFPIFFTFRF